MEIQGENVVGFCGFGVGGHLKCDQLGRSQVKKTHPNHGGCHCPMAAMVPYPQNCRIQQLANMLCDKSMLLKLDNIIVFTIYQLFKARRIIAVPCLCIFRLQMMETRDLKWLNEQNRVIEADWDFQDHGLPRNELVVPFARKATIALFYWGFNHGAHAMVTLWYNYESSNQDAHGTAYVGI